MWYTKIKGTYWKNQEKVNFEIDEPSEKAHFLYEGLLESLQYEESIEFEFVEEQEYFKETT